MYCYVYSDHLGADYYVTDYEQNSEELYCQQCGDSDTLAYEGEPEHILYWFREDVKKAIREYREMQKLLRKYRDDKKKVK
jgi:hypothetical protein